MHWIKKNTRLVIGICLSLALGLGAGYGIRGLTGAPPPSPSPVGDVEPVGQIGRPSILPTTQVLRRYHFLLCGHEMEQTEFDGVLTGCTLEDIVARIPGARVELLNSERAVVAQELESYCPQHYVLFLNGGDTLCILHTDSEDLEMENTQVLTYDVGVLPEEVLLALEEGLVFEGLEQINAYLEDVES